MVKGQNGWTEVERGDKEEGESEGKKTKRRAQEIIRK